VTRLKLNPNLIKVFGIGLCWMTGCAHTETLLRKMTWSTQLDAAGTRELPTGAVRLTFVEAPKFHVRLTAPSLKQHLETARKSEVSVEFEVNCKHRQFSTIRVRSVDGVAVRTGPANMVLESDGVIPGKDPGPFQGACSY